jgi:RNA polymerase sigma-70 factor, ECF subfamily
MDDAEGRFRVVFESTYPALGRYARHRGLSAVDADDLVAGTYEVAWRRLDAVPPGEGTLPWLLAVERNLLRNHWRKRRRERAAMEHLGPPQDHGSEIPMVSWQDIRRALDCLSEEDRELVLLVAWDGLAPAQAAVALGLTPGAARTRLHRARGRLAQLLDIEPDLKRAPTSGHNQCETASAEVGTDD